MPGDKSKINATKLGHFASQCCTKSTRINELQLLQDDESKQGQLFSILCMKGLGS